MSAIDVYEGDKSARVGSHLVVNVVVGYAQAGERRQRVIAQGLHQRRQSQ